MAKFKIFGNGPMSEQVKRAALECNASRCIHFMGYVNPVIEALEQIDLLIVPSLFDGRPNIIMEANACGIPVLAAPVGGIPEMIEEGINGFLCRSNDLNRLVRLVEPMVSQPDRFRDLCEQTRRLAVRRFDISTMIDKYNDLFENI